MIKKIAQVKKLNDSFAMYDLKYWLDKSPKERIAAVEYLRRQFHGGSARLQRVVNIVKQRSGSILN